jgi:phosphonate ABC transporter substrate-binding protein
MILKFVSLMAEPLTSGYRELCRSLSQNGFPVEFVETDWRDARQMLVEGKAQIAGVCGLLYALMRSQGVYLNPVVSPVLNHPRYDKPVYWADIVVRKDSRAENFHDLRGLHWLYNEEGSYSGYRAMTAELVRRDLDLDFLGTTTATGSHQESFERLLAGVADFTVLDSTFLDFQPPEARNKVKTLHSIGPAPAPLVVGFGGAGKEFEQACRGLSELPSVFKRLDSVTDSDYQLIRRDWNKSTLASGSSDQSFLVKSSSHPPFASVERQLEDQRILGRIGDEMLSLRHQPAQTTQDCGTQVHKSVIHGLEHHHYFVNPEGLKSPNLSLVGFLSCLKPDGNLKALFDADDLLLKSISSYEGFLTYSPTEYAPGKWANLAVFSDTGCRDRWACDSEHMKAIRELASSSYEHVRLHLGVWPSIDEPQEWIATRYLDYTQPKMWRAVRTDSAG